MELTVGKATKILNAFHDRVPHVKTHTTKIVNHRVFKNTTSVSKTKIVVKTEQEKEIMISLA